MCPTSRSWTTPAARMGLRLRPVIHRRRQWLTRQRMRRLHRRRHLHRTRPQVPLAAPSSEGCLAVLSPEGLAERSPARSPAERLARSPARRPPAGPAIIWRKATVITDIRRDSTFRSIRGLAFERPEARRIWALHAGRQDVSLPAAPV